MSPEFSGEILFTDWGGSLVFLSLTPLLNMLFVFRSSREQLMPHNWQIRKLAIKFDKDLGFIFLGVARISRFKYGASLQSFFRLRSQMVDGKLRDTEMGS
jgi:hypothetical protein